MKRIAFFLAFFVCVSTSAVAAPWPSPTSVGGGFGVQVKGGLVDDDDLRRIRETGFGFVRFSFGWAHFEPEKGRYDWRDSDALIARVRAQGLKMVIPLMGGHPLYDGWSPAPKKNVDHVMRRPTAPQSAASAYAYARWAAATAARYDGPDIVWEIWNEPDLPRFWPPKAQASGFAALADITCQTMRSVVPQATIVGPALGRVPDARDGVTPAFLETFLASGAARCVNAVSVHPYRHGNENPEGVFGDYETLFLLMAKHRVFVPIVNSEWGYTTTQVSLAEQEAFVLRARLIDMVWGVPLSIWYEWRDSRPDPQDDEGHFGLARLAGPDKPALARLARILPRLADKELVRQVHAPDLRDIVLLLRGEDGAESLVGWTIRKPSDRGVFARVGSCAHRLTVFPEILAEGIVNEDIAFEEEGAGR